MTLASSPVGIIGGGPVGLMMGLLLARQGVKSLIFERKPGISTHPKAMGVSRRTAEIYRQLGLYDEIARGSLSSDGHDLAIWSTTLVGGEELGRTPLAGEQTPFTPVQRFHCPQTWTEKVLYNALQAEPLAEVRFNVEVTAIEQAAESVTITLQSGEIVEVPWLVAADGAGGATRHQLGIEAFGPGDMGHFLNTMFRANYGPLLGDRAAFLYQVLSTEYFEAFVSVNGEDIWLMHHFLMPGDKIEDYPPSRLADIIRYVSGVPEEPVEVLSVSPWVMSPKVAAEFRKGRVFLVGDAAARLSPTGGLGLNTGLQSAHNLAWKLAFVIQGRASEGILDTYQSERQGVALETMGNTNKNADEIIAIVTKGLEGDLPAAREMISHSRRAGSGLGQDLGVAYESGAFVADGSPAAVVEDPVNDYVPSARPGARLPYIPLATLGSTLDCVGGGFVLLHGGEVSWEAAGKASGVATVAVSPEDASFFATCGIDSSGALLVRPDGYVAARWSVLSPDVLKTVQEALSTILGV